jgi:sugar transferase (PEP-CTERM/EpsH1 system associated)
MTGALKVTHLVLSLDVGGLERVVLDLVREGQALGQSVSVLCLERPGVLACQAEALGARVACASKTDGLHPWMVWRLFKILRQLRPDVLHSHHIGALFYGGLAARAAGVPVVVHSEHGKHYAVRRRTRWLGRIAGCTIARFFCVSQDIAEEVEQSRIVSRAKIRVVPNGIDTERFRKPGDPPTLRQMLGIPPGAPVVGTIGRLHEIKQQDLLLRAFAKLRDRMPEAHLLLVGDGPLMGDLRGLAAQLGLGDAVHFAGYQARPEQFLHLMNVFALTSRSEGMPLAILEAWAAGVPVVASRVGGVPQLIQHGQTGLLFEPGDESGLIEALSAVVGDPVLARAVRDGGHERVEASFTLAGMAAAYHAQYLALLTRRRTPAPIAESPSRECVSRRSDAPPLVARE